MQQKNSQKHTSSKYDIKSVCKTTVKKLLQINATNRSIALGAAIGFGIALTPLFGLQIILTLLLCIMLRANIAASLISSIIGNPLTFPFIWIANYKLGKLFITTNTISETSFIQQVENIIHAIKVSDWAAISNATYSILLPMMIGGTIMAIVSGIIIYILTLKYLNQYKGSHNK